MSDSGRMLPSERLDIEVEVLWDDGAWHPGWLEHWRQVDGTWQGFVRFSTGYAETRIGWFTNETQMRRGCSRA